MNNKLKLFALGSMLAVSSTAVHAQLSNGNILNFDDGVWGCAIGGTYPDCDYGVTDVVAGSFFAMDINGSGVFDQAERIVIVNAGTGFTPGVAQVVGAIDNGWSFGGSTGWHHTSSANGVPSVNADGTVDMTGWTVFWGSPPNDINMGTGAAATVTCTSGTMTCADGESFTLDYESVVPDGGFAGVAYQLHLEGTVRVPVGNTAPTAVDDNVTAVRSSTGNTFNILLNDTDPEANIDIASIVIQTVPTDGTVTENANGTVTYDNNGTTLDPDSFTYTVKDTGGLESNIATVIITIENQGVFAADDSASIDTATETSVDVAVTANDDDGEGVGFNLESVMIVQPAVIGATSINAGVVTYTPNAGEIGTDKFTYTVENNNGTLSNEATVVISVSNSGAAVLDPNAYFIFDTGNVPIQSVKPAVGEGTWFSMEVVAGLPTYTPLAGFNHFHLGEIQRATSPGGENILDQNMDQAWNFFGQLGVTQTTIAATILTDDGAGNVTLNFEGWDVSWNGITSIPLGNGQDNGIATLTCYTDAAAGSQGTCAFDDEFTIDYRAIVPDGDPSGFGNVNYVLHMEGVISETGVNIELPVAPNTTDIQAFDAAGIELTVQPGDTATNAGSTTGANLSASDVGIKDPRLNTNDGEQCVGGCVDFVTSGFTTEYVDIVVRLNKALPQGVIYRKLLNGIWGDFNQAQGDIVGSNVENFAGVCQDAIFSVGLRAGNNCVLLRIYDGGPNDADGIKNGVIVDPSGVLLAGSPNVPEGSTSGGCSISNTPASIVDRADWLLVAAFLAALGLVNAKRRKSNS